MFEARHQDDVTIIRGTGELTRAELVAIAAVARRAREHGRRVVVDMKKVTHLHYAGAALLKSIPGLHAAGASRYVRDLVSAGGAGAHVEFHEELDEAVEAV